MLASEEGFCSVEMINGKCKGSLVPTFRVHVGVVLELGARKREDAGKCKLGRICKNRNRSILCMLYKSVTCDFFT